MKRAGIALWLLLGLVPPTGRGQSRVIWKFTTEDNLDQIRAIIGNNGYRFTVGHNRVFDMPPDARRRFFTLRSGALPPAFRPSDDMGPLREKLRSPPPEPAFCWTNVSGRSYIGPVRDQGSCGSCYAFGACAAAEATYNFAAGLDGPRCADFSESFIAFELPRREAYREAFSGCEGGYHLVAMSALTQEGICNESDYPYTGSDPGPFKYWDQPRVAFASWHAIPSGDIQAIKTAIRHYGAVIAAVKSETAAFRGYANGIYEDEIRDGDEIDHAVSLIGWDDNGGGDNGYWILRNSWGPDWGENGTMRIQYTSANVASRTAYVVYEESAEETPVVPPPAPAPVPPEGGTPAGVVNINNDGWNDLSGVFLKSARTWLFTDNAYPNKAGIVLWAAYEKPQQFQLAPFQDPARDPARNYAGTASFRAEPIGAEELDRRLAKDGVGFEHRKKLEGPAPVYRLEIEARDNGSGHYGSYQLRSTTPALRAIARADIDDGHVAMDRKRAQAGWLP